MTTPAPSPDAPQNAYGQQPPLAPSDERTYSTLVHVGGIFFGFIPALIGYLVFKDRGALIRQHSATALNFQVTIFIVNLVASFLIIVGTVLSVVVIGFVLLIPGILIALAAWLVVIIFSIIAAIAANNGQPYTYPLTVAFIK